MNKVNLLYGSGKAIQGYVNISPFPIEDAAVKICQLDNLGEFFDNGELDEILVDNVLAYIPHSKVVGAIHDWCKKLGKGGKLIIVEPDASLVAHAFSSGFIDLSEYNEFVFGNSSKPYLVKRSAYTADDLVRILDSQPGMKITRKALDGNNVVMEATRE